MSFFYVRSDFFAAENLFADSYSSIFSDNQFLTVSSENFNSSSFSKDISYKYLQSLNIRNSGNILWQESLGLDDNGSTFDVTNLYLFCGYKSGQVNCVSPNAASTLDNVQLKTPSFLGRVTLLGDVANPVYTVDINSYRGGIIVKKVYHKMLPSGDGSSATMASMNMTDEEISKVPTNNLYLSYSYCTVLNFTITPVENEQYFYYKNLIIIENRNLDYLEDFSDKFYYDAGTQRYYLDSSLTECSVKMCEQFYPYLLLTSSDGWVSTTVFHGPVKLQLESENDTSLDNVSADINYGYIDICNAPISVATNNTISCTSNAGEVSVNVNGIIKLFDDQQICPIGGTAKTVIAVFSLKPSELLSLYKDFSAITTVKADIWGYNFRYIKYYDGTTYYNFKDNGSVASVTVSYIDEILDLSKYFSLKETSDGSTLSDSGDIVAITLRFKIYKSVVTDADATDYSIDIPVEIKKPEILSIDEDIAAGQIIIKTNYATKLTYRFNEESSTTINITDSVDGSNQETIISSSGKIGSFYCKAYNFYYDLGGTIRKQYLTDELSLDLIRNVTIPSFNLTVKIGGSSKTIYDDTGSPSSLNFTDLTQDQIRNYKVYSDYISDNGSYTFQLSYSLTGSKYSSMYLRIGRDPALHPLILSAGTSSYTITKQNLFKLLDNDNQTTLSFLANGEAAFDFPFTFLNTSQTNSPVCNAFSLSRVQLNYPKASTTFTLSYTYADEVEYSVIDQNDNIFYGPILIKEKFADIEYYFTSGATRQRSFEVNQISLPGDATTLRVKAIVRNIISATANPQKAEDTRISSSIYNIPLKIGSADVVLYSDDSLSTTLTKIKKGEDFWAFLELKDEDGNVIYATNYANYLAIGYKPEIFMLESADSNKDLDGVTSVRVSDYIFKFNIKDDDKFNDQNAVFQAQYQPIIDTEIP